MALPATTERCVSPECCGSNHFEGNVAHGEYIVVEAIDYELMQEEVIRMLDGFKTQIENAAVLRRFTSQPVS